MALIAPLRTLLADGAVCVAFFSRLPLPAMAGTSVLPRPFGVAIRMLPVAALVIGGCGAIALLLGAGIGMPHPMAAVVGIAAGLLATGGLHEDGLADTADGLGGGATRGRKLDIMRDSRIGTYGVLALVVALAWRIAAWNALLDRLDGPRTACLVLAAAVVSRALALVPLAVLAPARSDGLGHGVGALDRGALAACFGLATIIGVALPLAVGVTLLHALLGCALAGLGAAGVTRLAERQIGGHTGDIAGASQQVAEAGYLLGLLVLATTG